MSFVLPNINIERIGVKFGGMSLFENDNIDNNTTKIENIDASNIKITAIDSNGNCLKRRQNISCFWDTEEIDGAYYSCPIKFYESQVSQEYNSYITGEKYSIIKKIDENFNPGECGSDVNFLNPTEKFYATDGFFCSTNCTLAFIINEVQRNNSLYFESEKLLYKMRYDMTARTDRIIPAPHWRLLKKFGGELTIKTFREKLETIEYKLMEQYAPMFMMTGCLYKEIINYKL